ncbi:transposable element Tcb2 transposase [Trichonephila clavipes]|nr:transposable element Tcb2 transposase [Trichonephila clavipes]
MVWAGILLVGRSPLHVFERGSVTGVRYRDEVLESYIHLIRDAWGTKFILMDDNVRPQPYSACLGRSGEGNYNSQLPSKNYPGNENSVAERVGPIATRTDKLSYF